MSTTDFALQATARTEQKKQVKALRAAGQIPAIVYGKGFDSQMVKVNQLEFLKIFHRAGSSALVELSVDEHKPLHVLITEVQNDHLGSPRHIDFHQVNMNETIRTEVPLKLVGDAPGVYNLGGSLIQVLEEIEVEALPANLPQAIEVDITGLEEFDAHLSVSDLVIPANVTVMTDEHEMVCKIEAPRSDEEMAELDAEIVDAVAEGAEEAPAEGEEADKAATPEAK